MSRATTGLMLAPPFPMYQAPAELSQTNPTSGTLYEVLATTINCRIIGISAVVTWGVQPDPLQVHVTIDGETITFNKANPVSGTWYYAHLSWKDVQTSQELATSAVSYKAFILEGRSVRVQAETTGGTVTNLSCKVYYSKYL